MVPRFVVSACAAAVFALAAIAPASAASERTNNIGDVFRDFETICFNYAEQGYSLELNFLIEIAGFKHVQRTAAGDDIFNSDLVQLVIGDKSCGFGIPHLPFAQMLEWTKPWAAQEGLTLKNQGPSGAGDPYWVWSGSNFDVGLENDKFADGTQLTGLVLFRR